MPGTKDQKFHIGICMAGAITAGSYTAGVIDYILETLEQWQQYKEENKRAIERGEELPHKEVPMHDVVIDVISGASAGGMCAAITSAMLAEGIDKEKLAGRQSKMYKAWIELDDNEKGEGTLEKMLETDDLGKEGIISLLNSKVIENISKKTISKLGEVKLPPYVDENLDILLTISNLRGARYSISFMTYDKKTKEYLMSQHRDFMHFKLNKAPGEKDDFMPLDFKNNGDIELLQHSAVATGAFPVGLSPKALKRNSNYFYNKANSIAGIGELELDERKLKLNLIRDMEELEYESINVDGGAFNNEPFGEAERLLHKKSRGTGTEHTETNRAILMIDPFPSVEPKSDKDDMKRGVHKVGLRIISALRAQSSFKREDLIDALSDNNYLKYLIVPAKSGTTEPLSCASLEAFGGFLHKGFREHDYELGRRNAQQFLRKHFSMPFDETDEAKNNPIHRGWTKEAIEHHYEADGEGDKKEIFLPIIPDVSRKPRGEDVGMKPPNIRYYPLEKLRSFEKPIENRVKAMLSVLPDMFKKEEGTTHKDPAKEALERADKLILEAYFGPEKKPGLFGRITNGIKTKVFTFFISKGTREAGKRLSALAIKWMIVDLNRAGLLEKKEN